MTNRVLRTGEVARICCVSVQIVSKWIDEKNLKGFRVPGSTHRRVMLNDLVVFMRKNGMPEPWIEELTAQE